MPTKNPPENLWASSFDHSLPMSLLFAREAIMSRFTPILREHGLSPQQWRVLRVLVESAEQLDATELSRRCCLMTPSLSRILRSMEKRDLVTRSPNPNDQRRLLVAATAEGKDLHHRLTPHNTARFADIERLLGKEKLNQLYELLHETITTLNRNN